MGKKRLFLLFFLVFFAVMINGAWYSYSASEKRFVESYPVSEKSFVELSGGTDPFDQFSKEIISFLAEALPDKKTLDTVCSITYLREDIYGDNALITLFLKDKNNNNIIIWNREIEEMETPEAIKDSAQDAVHLLLPRLSRDLLMNATPITIIRSGAKKNCALR